MKKLFAATLFVALANAADASTIDFTSVTANPDGSFASGGYNFSRTSGSLNVGGGALQANSKSYMQTVAVPYTYSYTTYQMNWITGPTYCSPYGGCYSYSYPSYTPVTQTYTYYMYNYNYITEKAAFSFKKDGNGLFNLGGFDAGGGYGNLTVTGFQENGGVLSQTLNLSSLYQTILLNWTGLLSVNMSLDNAYANLSVDNIKINEPAPAPSAVPIPAAAWLFGSAFAAMGGFGRRNKRLLSA